MTTYKIIHQIWFQGKNNVPHKYKKYIDSNINNNPDWEYNLWDEQGIINLMADNKLLNTFNKLTYMHQKIDFAKYVMLYYYGGIYIDMDAYAIKSLNSLIEKNSEYDLIVSKLRCNMMENYIHCGNKFCVNNGVIYAKPKSTILFKMIEYVTLNYECKYTNKVLCIEKTTGPKRFTDIIMQNPKDNIKILESEYFEPCILNMCEITDNTYIVHKHEGSWYSEWLKRVFMFYLKNKSIIYLVCFLFVIILVLYYLKKNEIKIV